MKKNITTYIDMAHIQGQLIALIEMRNKLQEEINKKEEEYKKLKEIED